MYIKYQPVLQLCDVLGNKDFPLQLAAACKAANIEQDNSLVLHIEASLGPGRGSKRILLGSVDLQNGQIVPVNTTTATAEHSDYNSEISQDQVKLAKDNTPSEPDVGTSPPSAKRRKIGGMRPVKQTESMPPTPENSENGASSVRQVHTETRFPQRKKPEKDVPVLEPTSTDKLIAGIWKQLFSSVQLTHFSTVPEPSVNIRTGVSCEVFQAVNVLCMKYYNQSQSSRALEMIVQAYWIECYEARIAVIRLGNPNFSTTEARMMALKEACAVLNWKEKDLRNRMAIWRGYKEIKDAGGWASLIFASTGVYRFCKYRTGFSDGFATHLRPLRSSFEVAADTLHPEWRGLLHVIGQEEPRRYDGHPHEWVTVPGGESAVPLDSTYGHLKLPNGFQYKFIDECVLDQNVFGIIDPRMIPELESTDICQVCKERQSDDIKMNQCSCFPSLFGSIRSPAPIQIFHTTSGRNNGVIARCNFERGTAIGEFTGLITNGIHGVDVMVGGTRQRTYQIFQGQMGNFTRFINHSCKPNSQFQKFYWCGKERILVVSRGITAGSEITVDYSDSYWRQLYKRCLCGEYCCRFS